MNFFAYEYDPAVKFDMYTPMHLLMLGITLVLVVVFFLFSKRIAQSQHEQTIRRSFAGFFIGMQILLIIVDGSAGNIWLPFHLCAISYLLTIALLITDNKRIFKYVFFTGIIGGLVTFAIPELDHAGYNRFRFYEFIIAHTALIVFPIYYLVNRKFEITRRDAITAIVITNIIGFAMIPVNILLDRTGIVPDANYMFVMNPPEDVQAVFGTFPWHMLTFELVLLVTFFGLYAIAAWYQRKQKAA